MAITVTKRHNAGNNSAGTSWAFSPTSDFSSGSHAALFIAADNSSTNGDTNNISSVTDSLGNTWTKYQGPLYDPGSANQGVQGGVFSTPMDAGTITTSTTITVNFGASTTAKGAVLFEVTPTTGYKIVYSASGDDTAGATTTAPSMVTGTITANNLVICGVFAEYGSDYSITFDSDTSNGSWSSGYQGTVGTGTTGITVFVQYKVVTGTATQTHNMTTNSMDVHASWIEFSEIPASAGLIIGGKINNGLTLGRIIR